MNNDFQELIGVFIAETQEFLQSIETHLLGMEDSPNIEGRLQLVKEMFRAAHSIKGSALMFGFEKLSAAAHTLEDCFAILRDRADLSQLKHETVTALLRGVDLLRTHTPQQETVEGEATNSADFIALQESLQAIKVQLEADFVKKEAPPAPAAPPANMAIIKVIFEKELPPIFQRLETEISQITAETFAQTLKTIAQIYYQLSGLAGMLNLPDFGKVADDLKALTERTNLTPELWKIQAQAIAKNLQTAREQVCAGQPINVPYFSEQDVISSDVMEQEPVPAEIIEDLQSPLPNQPSSLPNSPSKITHRPTIRVDLERLTELVNLVGELVINRTNLEVQEAQLRSEVKRIRRRILDLNQYGGQLREEYDRLAGEGGAVKSIYAASNSHKSHFDALEMDEYTEFHSTAQEVIETTQAIGQSATKIDELAKLFERSTDQLRRITDQLRSRVMQLRVVPFSRAVDHLPRAVRNLCKTHHKEVNLLLLGRDTKIDESLLDALRDPLVHLVRNAFDHGIETPEIRKAMGKPPTGQIEIEARHQGGQTIITVTDDGKGIDTEVIRRRVIENQLVPVEQAEELSVTDLYEFLFAPGFSTANEVSNLSGRGVGLDVVRNNLRQVRGTVKLDSRPGKGTSFIIKLPLMLSITDALLVRTDHNTVAVPLDAVEEILHLQANQIHRAGKQPMLRWRGEFIRLMRLQELIHYSIPHPDGPSPDPIAQDHIPVIVLASSEGILATAVERLVGQQEIVVKPLPSPLSKPHGVVGCTILGDGRVVTILDVDDLIAKFQHRNNGFVSPEVNYSGLKSAKDDVKLLPNYTAQPLILVVDDSYTIRQLLALTLTRARYRSIQAKDGQEALELLQGNPDCALVIADIEMPRMDGFELLKAIKSDPSLARVPVAMLTSRSGAKHRQTALELGACHYFTKPYSEAHLLEIVGNIVGAN